MASSLHISADLSLPLEAVTQTFAILAKRGAGKSYTASVMAEEMLKAGQQIVAIDPTGSWWGLRSLYPIVVLGGEHGDVPLEESAGEVIARAIVEHRFPAVVDLSLFRKGQLIRFMLTFAETLYRLNREPVHLFFDEADAVAPQERRQGGDENRMLGAMEDIVRRGRKRGIGCTLITQRPAVLNKNVLTQCESLFALRLTHPRDIGAIREWIDVHADPAQAKLLESELPSLPIGTAWFWSPGWLGIMQKVAIRKRETFDSSATPKPGESPRKPKSLAAVDVAALGDQIQQTVQKAKADDPKELRKKIAELEKLLSAKPAAAVDQAAIERAITAAVAARDREWQATVKQRESVIGDLSKRLVKIVDLAHVNGSIELAPLPAVGEITPRNNLRASPQVKSTKTVAKAVAETNVIHSGNYSESPLGKGERRILTAIAQHGTASREQLTVLTGYKRSSRDAYLQRLRTAGAVEQTGDEITATPEGLAMLGTFEELPTGCALLEYWLGRLTGGERELLRCIAGWYPEAIDRDALSTETGYKRSSRDAYLQRLKSRRLIDCDRGTVKANDSLFD